MLCIHISWRLLSFANTYTKFELTNLKTDPRDPIPTCLQHKYHDSLFSHSASALILLRRPQSSTYNTATSATLCTTAWCTYSTNLSIVWPSTTRHIVLYVYCSNFIFSWSDRVSWQASSSHCCNLAFRWASFLCNSSAYACHCYTNYNFMRRCTGTKVCAATRTSSYFRCVSLTSVFNFYKLRPSCKFVHNSIAWLNILSLIVAPEMLADSLVATSATTLISSFGNQK